MIEKMFYLSLPLLIGEPIIMPPHPSLARVYISAPPHVDLFAYISDCDFQPHIKKCVNITKIEKINSFTLYTDTCLFIDNSLKLIKKARCLDL